MIQFKLQSDNIISYQTSIKTSFFFLIMLLIYVVSHLKYFIQVYDYEQESGRSKLPEKMVVFYFYQLKNGCLICLFVFVWAS